MSKTTATFMISMYTHIHSFDIFVVLSIYCRVIFDETTSTQLRDFGLTLIVSFIGEILLTYTGVGLYIRT